MQNRFPISNITDMASLLAAYAYTLELVIAQHPNPPRDWADHWNVSAHSKEIYARLGGEFHGAVVDQLNKLEAAMFPTDTIPPNA